MRIIFDGNTCLEEYLRILKSAKKSIWISMYMIRFDTATRQIWNVLRQKHAEGVKIVLWYDMFGSFRSLPTLISSGFCKMFVPRWYKLFTRNHAKVIIVDEKFGIVSGRNLTKRYFGEWVDASIITEDKNLIKELLDFRKRIEQKGSKQYGLDGGLQITDPLVGQRSVYNGILENIVKSKKRIIIASPYFVIDDAIEGLLLAAADRGVKITVILPKKTEHKLAAVFNRINLQRITHPNVLAKHSTGMFHSKVMLFDDTALIGSANFDNRSFKYNFEASVVVGSEHVKQVKQHLDDVGKHSINYHWIQRTYDSLLYHLTRHLMEFL